MLFRLESFKNNIYGLVNPILQSNLVNHIFYVIPIEIRYNFQRSESDLVASQWISLLKSTP